MSAGDLSVIIPTRDRPQLIARVLGDLRALPGGERLDLVVVDNGSRDPAVAAAITAAGATRVRVDSEFNFSLLCNVGAAHAGGEQLLFLNDDIEITQADALDRLRAGLDGPEAGPVGAVLLYPDGSVQHWGIDLAATPVHRHLGLSPAAAAVADDGRPAAAVTGACLLITRELFDRLGGFDPLLHTSYNDVDLCLRAAALGHRPTLVTAARLIHHESASRGTAATAEVRADWFLFRTRWGHLLATTDTDASPA